MFAFVDSIEMPAVPADRKCFTDIPTATHIEDVENYLAKAHFNPNTREGLRAQSSIYKKYHNRVLTMEHERAKLETLIETTKANMQLVKKFQEDKSAYDTRFQVCEGLYQTVTIPPLEKVSLVVANDTLMQFKLDEAEEYLKIHIKRLVTKLKMIGHDIDYLREQLTNTQTNITRIHAFSTERQKLYGQSGTEKPRTSSTP